MICDKPKEWVNWLALAEYCYNTSIHHSTRVRPFEAIHGYLPPRLLTMLGKTRLATALLKENIQRSQDRMKKYDDLKRIERSFEGEWVYLRL